MVPDGVAALTAFADARAFGKFSTHSVYKSFRLACVKLLKADDEKGEDAKDLTPYACACSPGPVRMTSATPSGRSSSGPPRISAPRRN